MTTTSKRDQKTLDAIAAIAQTGDFREAHVQASAFLLAATSDKMLAKRTAAIAALDLPPKPRGSVVPESYKRAYGKAGNNGDQVVRAIAEAQASGTTLEAIATENGVDFGRWSHLNNGMQRMNLGNVLRGLCRKEEVEVRIGTWTNTVAS